MTDHLTDAERISDADIDALLWMNPKPSKIGFAMAELKALREQCKRQRSALESLWPGLVLDLRYADPDDDKEAMQSRIDTVVEALSPCSSSSSSGSTG
jgi:hypothetical protein